MGRAGGRLLEGGLYALLFLLPFSGAGVEITFVVMLLGWNLERLDPATRRSTLWLEPSARRLALALAIFLGACALSIVTSDYPHMGVRALIKKWLEYVFFLVIAADAVRRPGVLSRAIVVLGCSSALVLVEGLTQELAGRGVFRRHELTYHRMSGPYLNPIDLATYLIVVIPIALAAALGARRGAARAAWWTLLVALAAALGRTESVGAWIGLGAALLVLVVLHPGVRRYGLIAMLVLLAAGSVSLVRAERFREAMSLSEIGKVDRWMMWQAALGMIRDKPVTGHGLNTFMEKYLAYWVGGERQPRYAHNCYLQMAAETGVIGLVSFLAVLGALFSRLVAALRRLEDATRWQLLGLVGGLAAFAVQAALDTNFYSLRHAALFWTLSGMAMGLAVTASGAKAGERRRTAGAAA